MHTGTAYLYTFRKRVGRGTSYSHYSHVLDTCKEKVHVICCCRYARTAICIGNVYALSMLHSFIYEIVQVA
jgi:hypothetical protein